MTQPPDADAKIGDDAYRRIAALRHGQRRFLHWSAEEAAHAGLTATQHQLLLGIRASTDAAGSTIGDIAHFLCIRHHSAVELVDRAERDGLVERLAHPRGAGHVLVRLTPDGRARLEALTIAHLRELTEIAPRMSALWEAIASSDATLPPERER